MAHTLAQKLLGNELDSEPYFIPLCSDIDSLWKRCCVSTGSNVILVIIIIVIIIIIIIIITT